MNTEGRIRAHLEESTAHLIETDRLAEIIEEGNRRRLRARMGAVLAMAAVVAVVVLAGQALRVPPETAPVLSQPDATAPTETTVAAPPVDEVLGVLVSDADGVAVVDVTGATVRQLTSNDSEISVAFPDGRGGLVFQHATASPPLPQGSLLRLGPGESAPTIIDSPPSGGSLVPVGPAGDALFLYLVDAAGETSMVLADLERATTSDLGPLGKSTDVTVGGDLISLIDRSGECPTHSLRRLDGREVDSPLPECLPLATGVAVAGDGSSLAMLNMGELDIHSLSGQPTFHATIPEAYMVTSTIGGWAVRTPTETLLLNRGGGEMRLNNYSGWVAPFSIPLDIAPDATLGGG